jgi:hypothetical protein
MAIRIPIITDFQGDGLKKTFEEFKKLETNAEKASFALKKAFVPAAAALTGLAVAGGKAVSMASDLAETQNKVGVIFGASAKNVQEFSKNANKALGQTQNEALTAASTFGAFGKAAGLAGDDLVAFSTDFVTLASDLASFNNSTPEEATMALGAALRGEAEPLRRFNILLDDATLKAKATELGIYKGNGALTAQQKILAAQKAIMEQSSDAQGDFIETSGGLANQQRILKATLIDTTTQIGMALLPAVEAVLPLLTAFAGWASKNTAAMVGIGAAIGVIATSIVAANVGMAAWKAAGIITSAVNWALAASFTAVQIATGIGIAVVIAGVAAFALYQRQMNGLKNSLGAFNTEQGYSNSQLQRMSDSGKLATTSLEGLIPQADGAGKAVDKMAEKIKDARKELDKQFSDALDKAKDKLKDAQTAYDDFKKTISESITGKFSISGAYDTFTSSIRDLESAQEEIISTTESLTKAQERQSDAQKALNKLLKDPEANPDSVASAQERYADSVKETTKAVDELAKASKDQKDATSEASVSFFDRIREQAAGAKDFGAKIEKLLSMGLSQDALRSVLEAGQEAGSAIANELIIGGSDAISGPNGINTLVSDLNFVADALGTLAADKFYQAGVTQGEQYLAGVQSAIQAAEQLLKNPNLKLADVKGIGAKFASDLNTINLGPTSSPTFTGDTSGIMAERGGNNYTVNINGGIMTNAQTGKVVIDAVKSFNRASGPADIAVRPIAGRY